MASIESRIARTISGNPMIAEASAAPVQRNANTMPNHSLSMPDRAAFAEQQEKRETDDDRRQHQGQMHEHVDECLPGNRARASTYATKIAIGRLQGTLKARPAGSAG